MARERERESEREHLRSRSSSLVLPGLPHFEAAEALAGFIHLIVLMPSAKMLAYQRERERERENGCLRNEHWHLSIYLYTHIHR
jgi:hypothetical protein